MKPSASPGASLRDPRARSTIGADLSRLESFDVVCFSHLRWDFVVQRPHHLMTRCAAVTRVFYVEEPVRDADTPHVDVLHRPGGVITVVPHLPPRLGEDEAATLQRLLLDDLLQRHDARDLVAWYYTPMALPSSRHLEPALTVYDCMDELSHFRGAPPALRRLERELFARTDLVFTGGQSLYEAKRAEHGSVHPFPSSIDAPHFARARTAVGEPPDQGGIPHPRLGYAGVIDERMDLELLDAIARERPEWQLVMIGPVTKIDDAELPRRPNIHYLGPRPYDRLPDYLAGWDVALLPFALNDATRYISPTKTPEYLAAGRPVVSTPIDDVACPYGERGLVCIADGADGFVAAIEEILAETAAERSTHRTAVDAFLARTSWDGTWARMMELIVGALDAKDPARSGRPAAVRLGSRPNDGP